MLEAIYNNGSEKERTIFAEHKFGLKEIQYEKDCIKKWFLSVAYNKDYQSFNCGYNEFGVDKTRALDTVSWAIAALGPEELVSWGLNPAKMIQFAEDNFQVKQEVKGTVVEGFDFTDEKGKDPNRQRVIWLEGTGEMILAYQVMADYYQRQSDPSRADSYQEKAVKFLGELDKLNKLTGLPDGVLPYTSYQPKDMEVLNTFFYGWEIPRGDQGRWVSSLSSTLWRIIAMVGFNPLATEQQTVGLLKNVNNEMAAKLTGKIN